MKKIIHFGKYYPPDFGGVESITERLAIRFSSDDETSVNVVCFSKNNFLERKTQNGVQIFRAPTSFVISSQPLGWQYISLCLRLSKNVNLIHLHAPNILAAITALLVPRNIPLLVHWHSDVVKKGALGYLVRPLEKCLLSRSNLILATSEPYANFSRTLRLFKTKVSVVPLGISDPTIENSPSLPHKLLNWINGRKIILGVGRLVPYKGFDVLIDACDQLLEDSAVVIVGDGHMKHLLSNKIRTMGLKDKVILVGSVGDEILHALFSNAYLFCLPSTERSEAFGVVLLEALANGLPIVATKIEGSGVAWVNLDGVTGINVPVKNAKALADACNSILSSQEQRAQYSFNARSRYLSEFTEDLFFRRMNKAYEKILLP